MRFPENLKKGGTIGFVAPSFGCTKKRERLAAAAKQKMNGQTEEIWKLLNLMK